MTKADERLVGLYAAHGSSALRLAFLLTGDRHTAEDLTQEAFARVGGRLMGLRDPERAAGYLYRTLMNLARGHGRRLQRDRNLATRMANERPAGSAAAADDGTLGLLLTLPLRQRTVLFLRHYLDMSEADAARHLDCSVAAVKSLTHRASQSLRRNIEGESP
ncbi:MAG TPA: sigma-70 family RNA polymerase sigma factor [Actinomycetota bacterium]|nr:sigma-70 family RNA polymerase sigma factor [Actinomycetota bacterium]